MGDEAFRENVSLGLTDVVDAFGDQRLYRMLSNDDVLELSRLGGATGFSGLNAIQKSTGISSRRVLQQGVQPIDLAQAIFERLERATGLRPTDFQQILFCHSHVDPQACLRLAERLEAALGLPEGRIEASSHGCAGFLKLLTDGVRHLDGQPERARIALISVETPEYWHDASDRLFCGIVSAGATAAVLEVGCGVPIHRISSGDFHIPDSRRPNPEPLFQRDATEVFDFGGHRCQRTVMRMNAEPVFLNGIELMLDQLRQAVDSLDHHIGQRVVVAPHQPSGKLLKALMAAVRTEYPQIEVLNNLETYGNTISCSIPTLLSRMDEVLQRNSLQPLSDGDHVILLGAGICMSEIADHMSAGHACLQWKAGVLNQRRPRKLAPAAATG
ncbi:MAG: 3-oxoacyl-[acyl-carrier-protein] synthase III C-terminal domain-containing protein [Planctomycetaceae bacterium]